MQCFFAFVYAYQNKFSYSCKIQNSTFIYNQLRILQNLTSPRSFEKEKDKNFKRYSMVQCQANSYSSLLNNFKQCDFLTKAKKYIYAKNKMCYKTHLFLSGKTSPFFGSPAS